MKRIPKRRARKRRTRKQKLRTQDRLVRRIEGMLARTHFGIDHASASEASYTSYARTALSLTSGSFSVGVDPKAIQLYLSLHTKQP